MFGCFQSFQKATEKRQHWVPCISAILTLTGLHFTNDHKWGPRLRKHHDNPFSRAAAALANGSTCLSALIIANEKCCTNYCNLQPLTIFYLLYM
eukprot:Gb_32392 [translate_table: standard]